MTPRDRAASHVTTILLHTVTLVTYRVTLSHHWAPVNNLVILVLDQFHSVLGARWAIEDI